MAEYIEREVTCADCIHYDICIFHHHGDENKKCVHFKNKADVVEVRHGEWKEHQNGEYWHYDCPFCDDGYATKGKDNTPPNYCQNCGAKMDGKGE